MKWFTSTFSFWTELAAEIRMWWIFRSAAREENNLKKILENDLRVDWLGRIYGVINMPEEVIGAAEEVQQAYVLQQISKFGPLTNELGISDIIYPEIERIPGTGSYLVIMWPQYDALGFWYIIGNLIKTTFVTFLIYLLGRVIWVNFHKVTAAFEKLLDLGGI